ncbi:Glycosyltransferase involved in cell wall biogenesis [hydrothermal vent metagenome]|uniref:Glycosyltransferase involved in cell wall biogenesis n=1 Tax=hydrothermal vent metagenome TaxID=652676 RepID=A0A3B0SYL6_9ZZZZ
MPQLKNTLFIRQINVLEDHSNANNLQIQSMGLQRKKISALIITYNEIGYIENCIRSVAFADEIIVVDSYSADGTYEYLSAHPKVKVIQHPFKNYTAQKAFTLAQANNDWVIFVDADEVVTPMLRQEIVDTVNGQKKHVAYWFRRKFMFQQKILRFSGWQTDKNYRLFRKSKVSFSEKRIVHETLIVDGSSGVLTPKLTHFCYRNYDNYKGKMLCYGRLKAKEAILKNKRFSYALLLAKPAFRFLYNYFIRLGILDGAKGITVCYLNALGDWERFLELKRLEQDQQRVPKLETFAQRSN